MKRHVGNQKIDKDGSPICDLCGHYHYGIDDDCTRNCCEEVRECELKQGQK